MATALSVECINSHSDCRLHIIIGIQRGGLYCIPQGVPVPGFGASL